jgi:hypothetical protein
MSTWTNVTDTVIEPGQPIRSVDIIAIKNNILAVPAGAANAPRVQTAAIQNSAVTFDKLTTAAAGTVLLRRLTFGNNEIFSSTYEAAQPWSNVLGSYSVNIIKAGVVRVRFSHAAVAAGSVARVLKNGSQISEFILQSGGPVQRNVDVSVVAGDYITVQSRSTFGAESRIIDVQILSNQLAIVAV